MEEVKSGIGMALHKFSGYEIDIQKNKSAGRYRYADLPEVMQKIRTPLFECGLVLRFFTVNNESGLFLRGVLEHCESSGCHIMDVPLITEKSVLNPMQALGSAITYARRYIICCLLNVIADEDDDGLSSSPSPSGTGEVSKAKKEVVVKFDSGVKMDSVEVKEISNWHKSFPMIAPRFLDTYKAKDLSCLPKEVYPLMDKEYRSAYAAKCQLEGRTRP